MYKVEISFVALDDGIALGDGEPITDKPYFIGRIHVHNVHYEIIQEEPDLQWCREQVRERIGDDHTIGIRDIDVYWTGDDDGDAPD